MTKRQLRKMYRRYLFSYTFEAVPKPGVAAHTARHPEKELFVQEVSSQRQVVTNSFAKH